MKPLVILTGPTAVGKTALSLALAKAIDGEIISADSMQVYRYMDIGSAKLPKEQMEGVPHHLIDCLNPDEPFSVVHFQTMAKEAMQGIYERGHIPILVGGTGFYIQSVLYDIDFHEEEESTAIREALEQQAATPEGARRLYEELLACDPDAAAEIHENNHKRVIRAVEYYRLHGQPISKHNEEQKQRTSPYNSAYFVLNRDRATLYDRINRRVDEMFDEGLVKEVENLISLGYDDCQVAMQGLGYKQLLLEKKGIYSREEAIDAIKQETRHFAKRQLTWFRRERDVCWIELDGKTTEQALDELLAILKEKGIL